MSRQRIWSTTARLTGFLMLVVGVQWLVYERRADALEEQSQAQLAALRLELVDNREANAGLRALQDAWDATTDEQRRREFVALRDRVTERFLMDRESAISDFIDTVSAIAPLAENDEYDALMKQSAQLANIYTNRSTEALNFLDGAGWYLQPTASFLGDKRRSRLQFNAALHALLMRDLDVALEQLVELRQADGSPREIARIDYALARLNYARYQDERAVDGLTQSLELVRESLRNAPDDELPLLLLDYLLAMDRTVSLVEMETFDGQGSGQGDGERGALSGGSDKF